MRSRDFFELAAEQAKKSLCLRKKCGSVVVAGGEVIGEGYNAPPLDNISNRRCRAQIDKHAKYPTDKTCCVHAEVRAMIDALQRNPDKIVGSSLYYASVDEEGRMVAAGKPYCTICSKMALDVGVVRFCLLHESGPVFYPTNKYNELSFDANNTV